MTDVSVTATYTQLVQAEQRETDSCIHTSEANARSSSMGHCILAAGTLHCQNTLIRAAANWLIKEGYTLIEIWPVPAKPAEFQTVCTQL